MRSGVVNILVQTIHHPSVHLGLSALLAVLAEINFIIGANKIARQSIGNALLAHKPR